MQILTKYITKDDFKNYWGVDLEQEFQGSTDTPSAFIKRVEDYIARMLDANYFQRIDEKYPEFTDYQKEHYKLALLNQAYYVFRNSDLSTDSGYNPEQGEVSARNNLIIKALSPEAEKELELCGLLSRKIDYGRGVRFF